MDEMQRNEPLSVGQWFLTIFLLAVPILGLVMTLVWAFGKGNVGRKNFALATILWAVIGIALAFIMIAVTGTSALELIQNYRG